MAACASSFKTQSCTVTWADVPRFLPSGRTTNPGCLHTLHPTSHLCRSSRFSSARRRISAVDHPPVYGGAFLILPSIIRTRAATSFLSSVRDLLRSRLRALSHTPVALFHATGLDFFYRSTGGARHHTLREIERRPGPTSCDSNI